MASIVFDFKSIAEHMKDDSPKKSSHPSLPLSAAKKSCPNCFGCGHDCYGNSCDFCGGCGEGPNQ